MKSPRLDAEEFTRLVRPRAAAHLRLFRKSVELLLGDKVEDVMLFGSRARGDARRGSDYDVAVFVNGLRERKSIDHQLADLAYPHILKGVHIRPVSLPKDYLTNPVSGILADHIQQDGISVI